MNNEETKENTLLKNKYSLKSIVIAVILMLILAIIIIYRIVTIEISVNNTARIAALGNIQSTYAVTVVNKKAFPTVVELAKKVQLTAKEAKPEHDGLQLKYNGNFYHINTYTDIECTTKTESVKDKVKCVKDVTEIQGIY